jgi:Zn-dependent protease with chaperone function
MAEMAATAAPAGQPAQRPRVPTGLTAMFAVLVAAVLATGVLAFTTVYLSVPANARFVASTYQGCVAGEPVFGQPIADLNDVQWHAAAAARIGRCVAVVGHAELRWVGWGVALLFAAVALLYWLTPRYIIARNRLRPLTAVDCPELVAELPELVRIAGLPRPPTFRYAEHVLAADARVFGPAGRRCVQVSAGLVARYRADPAAVRAVLLHELAHLSNRDVDRTYLAQAVWYAFVAVALVPYAALQLHPRLLVHPLTWRAADFRAGDAVRSGVALAVLAGLAYLIRNAILRTAELHADARTTSWLGAGDALRDLLTALPSSTGPRWRRLLDRHPSRAQRLHAIDEPTAVLLRDRPWELFGAGFALAVLAQNLKLALGADIIAIAVVATGYAMVLAGLLGVTAWRAVARAGGRRPPVRATVLPAAVLVAGMVAGAQLSLLTAIVPTPPADYRTLAARAAVLAVGLAALSMWYASVIPAVRGDRRWPVPVVIAAGFLALAPWFAVWHTFDAGGLLFAHTGTGPRLPGAGPGWYQALAQLGQVTFTPVVYLAGNPLVLPGLTALWLVPTLLSGARLSGARLSAPGTAPIDLRPALLAGLVGTVGFTAACVGLIYAVQARAPVAVRAGLDYPARVYYAWIAIAVVAQVCVAGAVAVAARRHRAVLIPLAIALTGVLAVLVADFGLFPLGRCADVFGTRPLGCRLTVDIGATSVTVQRAVVEGVLLALPVAVVAGAVSALVRRRAGRVGAPAPRRAARGRLRRLGTPATAAFLAVTAAATVGGLPGGARPWLAADASDPATPREPVPGTHIEPCLIGTWTETGRASVVRIDGSQVRFSGAGARQRLGADGIGAIDFGDGVTLTGAVGGHPARRVITGSIYFRYETRDGSIHYSEVTTAATVTLTVDGVSRRREPLAAAALHPLLYSCRPADLSFTTVTDEVELRLVSRVPPVVAVPPPPAPPPAPVNQQARPCIVGTWLVTAQTEDLVTATGSKVRFTSAGAVQRFTADGTVTLDYGRGVTSQATLNGHLLKLIAVGKTTWQYRTAAGQIRYRDPRPSGTVTLTIDGAVTNREKLTASVEPERFSCAGSRLREWTSRYSIELRRTGR